MLNWLGVRDSFDLSGYNLIIHEVAHKLDARGSGYADGVPAIALRDVAGGDEDLHAAMSAIQEEVNLVGEKAATIDACAASSPAECFAVLSEYLFSAPDFCCLNASRHCITVSRSSTARTRFNTCLVMTYSITLAIDIVD